MKKILVCTNEHCRGKESKKVLEELKILHEENGDFDYGDAGCMNLCETGPNVITFPDLKIYKKVTFNRIDDIIKGKANDLLYTDEVYDQNEIKKYYTDPIHRRTIKLFRWHLDKELDFSIESLRKSISIFKDKYDIKETEFIDPVMLALVGTNKGPKLEKIIHYLEKKNTIKLLEDFLKNA